MRVRVLLMAAALAAAAFGPGEAAGQRTLDLEPGDRVRLDGRPVVASIVQAERDWIAYRLEGGDSLVWTRRVEHLNTLRVSEGVSPWRSARRGALWGVYLGAGLGAVLGPHVATLDREVGESIAVVGAGGGVAGSLLGAAVGAVLAKERWRAYLFRR